jgi:hypothetical protein
MRGQTHTAVLTNGAEDGDSREPQARYGPFYWFGS